MSLKEYQGFACIIYLLLSIGSATIGLRIIARILEVIEPEIK